jgi:hypothetical protein
MPAFTPRTFISGITRTTRARPEDAAAEAAGSVLGTENLALIWTRTKDEIWYLAAPAADLASHPNSLSPLASALPGASGHSGDGAYVCDLEHGLRAIVVKRDGALHSFVGSPAMVQRFAELEGSGEPQACTGSGMPWLFPAAASIRRETRLRLAITGTGLVTAVLAAIAWVWAAQSTSRQKELQEALLEAQHTSWAAGAALLTPPANPKALTDLQKAVAQAVQEKGTLVQFDYRDGRSTWTLQANGRPISGASN